MTWTEYLVNQAEEFYQTQEQVDRLSQQERSNRLELNKNGPVTATQWPMGRALRQNDAIWHLLLCPNRYPQGNNPTVAAYRAGLKIFEKMSWPHNTSKTWKDQFDLAIRYYSHICKLKPNDNIDDNKHVGGKWSLLPIVYKTYKNNLAANIIHCLAHGWLGRRNRLFRLNHAKKANPMVHHYFVLPLIKFFITEMDPDQDLKWGRIMTCDISQFQDSIKHKTTKYGVWSNTVIEPRALLQDGQPNSYGDTDHDVCKGLNYDLARLCAMIVQDFSTGPMSKNQTTDEEKRQLFEPLDQVCIKRV